MSARLPSASLMCARMAPWGLSSRGFLSLSLQLSSGGAHIPGEETETLKEEEMHRDGLLGWSEAGCPRNLHRALRRSACDVA